MVTFGSGLIQVLVNSWDEFKTLINDKLLSDKMQYDLDSDRYTIFFYDKGAVYVFNIYTGSVPAIGSYDQIQNDLDKDDFELNKKEFCNK
jgi:hypothetical protein